MFVERKGDCGWNHSVFVAEHSLCSSSTVRHSDPCTIKGAREDTITSSSSFALCDGAEAAQNAPSWCVILPSHTTPLSIVLRLLTPDRDEDEDEGENEFDMKRMSFLLPPQICMTGQAIV